MLFFCNILHFVKQKTQIRDRSSHLRHNFAVLPLLLLLFSFAKANANENILLPELGDATSGVVSPQQEYKLGRVWLRQLRAQAPIYQDPLAQQYIENLIFRLIPNSEVKNTDFEFVVIDQPELNAFAVPGGIIGVNLGLFLHANDEDELAAVMAHELAHLSQRHFARQIEAAEKQTPLTMASLLASILLIASSNPDAGIAGLVSTQAAGIQSQLAYSREWEREADRVGIKTLAQTGYDPKAMTTMFRQMLQANRYSQRPPEFLLTHPVTESRVADAAGRAESYPLQSRTSSFEFSTLKQQALVRYQLKDEEFTPYFEKAINDVTQLADSPYKTAQLNVLYYGYAKYLIEHSKQKSAQTDKNSLTKAEKLLNNISDEDKLNTAVIIVKSDLLLAQKRSELAKKVLTDNYQINPNSFPLALKIIQLDTQIGNHKAALDMANHWAQSRKNDPIAWQQLAKTAQKAEDNLKAHRAHGEHYFLLGQKNKALRQFELALKYAKQEKNAHQQATIRERLITVANTSDSLDI